MHQINTNERFSEKRTERRKDNSTHRKNTPRFLDYRRSPLPLDVALSFLLMGNDGSARDLILSHQVYVNNLIETNCHSLVCRYSDMIAVRGRTLQRPIPMPRYFVCYKPRGVICSNKRNEGIDRGDAVYISNWLNETFKRHICDPFQQMKTPNTVGRLDEESEGLLLLTNDGSFSRLLCDPEFSLSKIYRIIAKGSAFSSLRSRCPDNAALATEVAEMIKSGNPSVKTSQSQISYESCKVLEVGRLPTQHPLDDSYFALVDISLREGKTHAVRRIIKNSGLRVFYLSRIEVEGLDKFAVAKPHTLAEAQAAGFVMPSMENKTVAKNGNLIKCYDEDSMMTLNIGDILELKSCHVDNIFSLRTCRSIQYSTFIHPNTGITHK